MRMLSSLERLSPGAAVALGVALLALIVAADYLTGPDLSFHIFYLAPVALATWVGARRTGVLVAGLSALLWQLADLATGRPYELAITPYWNVAVRFASLSAVAYLLAALRRSLQHERDLARRDPLTGVRNSLAFHEIAEFELRRAQRSGQPLSLAYVDLDDFKQVNDQLGHGAGDAVLRAAAQAMVGALRDTDIVARLGGDEFAVLLPQTESEGARRTLWKLHGAILAGARLQGRPITASIGAITCRRPPRHLDELIRLADEQMYRTKQTGKNRVEHAILEPRLAAG